MRTRTSRAVAAGHLARGDRPIASIRVDGKKIDLADAAKAIEAAQLSAQRFSNTLPDEPSRLARLHHVASERVGRPIKSFATATIATIGSWFPSNRKTGHQAVNAAISGAAVGRARANPSGIRAWLGGIAENLNFARLVGLEVLASYHPDRVSELHKVEIEYADGEVVKADVEVLDHAASFAMNKLIVSTSGASVIPPGFPTGLFTFGTTATLMFLGSFIAGATGRRGLAASMRRVAAESAILAPVALTSIAADAVYIGASAVHLAMHRKVVGAPIVQKVSPERMAKLEGSMKSRIADAKKKARRQIDLTKQAKALAHVAPELLHHLEEIATSEAQAKLEEAIALHNRSVSAAEHGLPLAAEALEHAAEHKTEEAVDAKRVAIVADEALLAAHGHASRKGTTIGRIVEAEQDRPVPDTDGEPIDPSDAANMMDRLSKPNPEVS